jgi:hypothetical protein
MPVPRNFVRCFCCVFSPQEHAVVCGALRIISGGMFEALLVLYGGAAGLISLFIIQNPTLPTHHSNKNPAHALPLPPGCHAYSFSFERPSGWIYLRFFQVRGDYIVRGDASEVRAPYLLHR